MTAGTVSKANYKQPRSPSDLRWARYNQGTITPWEGSERASDRPQKPKKFPECNVIGLGSSSQPPFLTLGSFTSHVLPSKVNIESEEGGVGVITRPEQGLRDTLIRWTSRW